MYRGVPISTPSSVARVGRGLRHAEVDDLRRRPSVHLGDEQVRWLQVAVDDGLVVRVLHSLADLAEQLQPLAAGQPVPVAEVGDRQAADVLHHEVGPPVEGGARVEHLGDGGVIHPRQSLSLGLEAREELPGLHAPLEELEGDPAPERFDLLGEPHLAETSLADLVQEAIGSDPVRFLRRRGGAQPAGRGGWERGVGVVVAVHGPFREAPSRAENSARLTLRQGHGPPQERSRPEVGKPRSVGGSGRSPASFRTGPTRG
jgi:hypothetical protein